MSRLALTALVAFTLSAQQQQRFDFLLRGGTVVDGTGSPPRVTDIGITANRIAFIGDAASATAARTIDATGLIVAPGFIDPHTHSLEDLSSKIRHGNENYLLQGVTTVFAGNDGAGPVNTGTILANWTRAKIGTNALLYVGFGSVRQEVLGRTDVTPNPEQLDRMRTIVKKSMEAGAIGLSTGLFYSPQNFSKTPEVIEMAKVAAAAGGFYDSHMRDESSYSIGLLGSIAETIEIARQAHIPVNISHIKALGADVWGKSKDAIEMVRKARSEGLKVTADQYPYSASGSSLQASLMPAWAQEGGTQQMIARFDAAGTRDRVRQEMAENMRRRGGEDSFLLLTPRDVNLKGKRLGETARAASKPAIEMAIEIIRNGGSGVASFNMTEPDIEAFMKEDWVMTCSDGSPGHPRKYGTFPRKLRRYALDKQVISLEFMIRQSAGLVADTFHVKDRGYLKTNYFADVIVFDPKTVADVATYEQPEQLSTGMKFVFVNGQSAVENGKYTGALAGSALKR